MFEENSFGQLESDVADLYSCDPQWTCRIDECGSAEEFTGSEMKDSRTSRLDEWNR